MEGLSKVLSCPVCMELFTPPVLLLSCSHNFCKQCLDLVLVCQNCTHDNGQFCCPVCRKVIYLRGRGTNGLQRNILAENILEKFKEELETLHTKEQKQLAQMCKKHGEIMNLMCLSDEEPICGTCKLFGDHRSHQVAKISDAYAERKGTERRIRELSSSAADTRAMMDAIEESLLSSIRGRVATLKQHLESELSTKLKQLQLVAQELQAPRQLYQQMKALLQHHTSSVQFLHEHKKLKEEMERLMGGSKSPQVPAKDNISTRSYFQKLIKGIDITAFMPPETDQMLVPTARLREAWQASWTQGPLSQEAVEILCKAVSGWVPKSNEEAKLPGNPFYSPSSRSGAQGKEADSRESTV
ncbi:tripartite motif-containing protein 54 isoform X2 [Talpa occidentalis]|uniref:tripartite motif-containing protein 54 isoform X2 n=1 Tax=Talpa occidentalis TaxID=50954 RepID=UPI00188F2129|nr:tripartite motif-containing protein 54 isoform X2 [Talpa occidentalis]